MPTAIDENVLFKFGTPDIPEDDPSGYGLHVVNFHGEEGISRPYWFRLNLTSRDPKLDFDALVNQPGRLTLQRADRKCYLHGIVSSFEQGGRDGDWFLYRAVLRPRLWALTLTHRSRVFQNRSVPEIVREIFEEHGVPHEMEVRDTYEPREYVVQYNETDLAFISRLLAHEGIRFVFAQGEQRETVHLFDSRGQDPWVEGPTEMRYQLPDGMVLDETEVVSEVFVREQAVPGKVVLKDYNYRSPSSDLTSEEQDQNGKGEVYEYGLHFKDRNEGKRLAKVRKEEVGGQRRILAGRGNGIGFRAGHRFTLHGHYRDDLNEDYLLVRVRHFGGQEQAFGTAGRREFDGRGSEGVDYRNEFGCAPARVPFRTPRLSIVENFFSDTFFNATFENTIAPVFNLSVAINEGVRQVHDHHQHGQMYGLMTAPVQGGGGYGAVDDEGRYHVQLPFDREGAGSRPIRLAQPYAGAGDAGFHFPSHAGNEIVFACVDGDPDRPLALGFVPNPEHPSPVTSGNSSQHLFLTTSGNLLRVEDKSGEQNIKLFSPHGKTKVDIGYDKVGLGLRTDLNLSTYSGKKSTLHSCGGFSFTAWPDGSSGATVIKKLAPSLGLLTGFWFNYAKAPPSYAMHQPKTFKGKVYQNIKKAGDIGGYKFDSFYNAFQSLLKIHSQADTIRGLFKDESDDAQPSDPSIFDVIFPDTADIAMNSQGSFKVLAAKDASFATGLGISLKAIGGIDLVAAESIGLLSAKGVSAFAYEGGITLACAKESVKVESRDASVFVEAGDNISLQSKNNIFIATDKSTKGNIVMSAEEYHLYGNDSVKITAQNEIIFEVGQSKFSLNKDGLVKLDSQNYEEKITKDKKTSAMNISNDAKKDVKTKAMNIEDDAKMKHDTKALNTTSKSKVKNSTEGTLTDMKAKGKADVGGAMTTVG